MDYRPGTDYSIGGDRYHRLLADSGGVYDRTGQLYRQPAPIKRGVCRFDGQFLAERKAQGHPFGRRPDYIQRRVSDFAGAMRGRKQGGNTEVGSGNSEVGRLKQEIQS